jgi:hypothetical protein
VPDTEAAIAMPTPPTTGLVRDQRGVLWRLGPDDRWHPEPCPSCGTRVSPLTWPELLACGPLTEVLA